MRFIKEDKQKGWRLSFAWFPVTFTDENDPHKKTVIWLEKYWSRFMGYFNEVSRFEDKPF